MLYIYYILWEIMYRLINKVILDLVTFAASLNQIHI
jgi:hypothetical protein